MKKLTVTIILLTLFAYKPAGIRSIYHLPMQANAVCATDYDLDGDLDIVVNHGIEAQTQWGGIYFLENDGYGHFETMDSVFDSVAWVNYADTVISKVYPDIVYNYHDSITVLSYDGINYQKSLFYVGPKVNDFALGDVDGNGHLDVVFISSFNRNWGIIYNLGNSSFTAPVYYDTYNPPNDIACEDLNDDGKEDIVVAGASFNGEIWYGSENGLMKYQLPFGATNISIADLDNDGDRDIITFSDIILVSRVHVYENLGGNLFDTVSTFKVPEGSSKFFVTDFNNDSLPDLLFMTYNPIRDLLLYYNKGGFLFGDSLEFDLDFYGEMRKFMYCADMDGNGYNDIIISRQVFDLSYTSSLLEILFNDGHGNFVENPLTTIETSNTKHQTMTLSCYPNPVKRNTTIAYTLGNESMVDVGIYNMSGQKIKTLNNKILTKGKYKVTWDGTDKNGKAAHNGMYLVKITINNKTVQTTKILKLN